MRQVRGQSLWTTPQGTADAPTGVSATAGDGEATVSWTAPANTGGLVITRYSAVATPGGRQCSWNIGTGGPLQCTVTGLTNGTTYTFEVRAINSAGPSALSTPSTPVVPTAGSGGGGAGGGGASSGGSAASGSGTTSSGGGTATAKPTATIEVTEPVDGEATVTVGWSATQATAATTLTTTLPTGVAFARSATGCATARQQAVSVAVPALRKGQRGSCSYVVQTSRKSVVLTVRGGAKPASTAGSTAAAAATTASTWVRDALALLNRGTPRATLNATLDAVRAGRVSRPAAVQVIRVEVLEVRTAQIRALPGLGRAPSSLTRAERLLRRSLVLSQKADRAYIAWLDGDAAQLGRAVTYSVLATSAKARLLTSMQGHGVAIPPPTTTWP